VDVLVERELDKRSNALVSVMDLLNKAESELKKLKPDQNGFDDSGKVVSSSYSKEKLDERNKIVARIGKLEKAINKALDPNSPDYSDCYNLASGADKGQS
jgi:hypothetical protein